MEQNKHNNSWTGVTFSSVSRDESTLSQWLGRSFRHCTLEQLQVVAKALPVMEPRARASLEQHLLLELGGQPSKTGIGAYPTEMVPFLNQLRQEAGVEEQPS